MVRSLGLVLLVVAVILLITPRRHSDPAPQIDYRAELSSARHAAPYALLAPQGLPASWDATSVRYRPGAAGAVTWHLGFRTPHGTYAGLEQSNGPRPPFVRDRSLSGHPAGQTRVQGQVWERRLNADRDWRSLVRTGNGVTTVVSGSASWDDLRRLAATLRPG